MGYVIWRGVRLDPRTRDMMQEVAKRVPWYVQPSQGGYNRGGVAASAGTHDGGGAIDIIVKNLTPAERTLLDTEMRRVGFASWIRTPYQSNWPWHCHAIAVQPGGKWDQGVLSRGAHSQVVNYYDGRNGLASGAPDDGTRKYVGVTWEKYQADNQDWWESMTKAERKALIDEIATEVAARVNRTLGDYNSEGKPTGPNKDDPQLAAAYVRQIKNIVKRVEKQV